LFTVLAEDEREALQKVEKLCKEMRIFNPVVHEMEVRPYQGGRA